jgi:XapX domain-containing protein
MTGYLASLLMGLAVGVVYALVQVRSPAPPLIALVGLLGMVLGEQGGRHVETSFRAARPDIDW